jgi:O-methyltransferase
VLRKIVRNHPRLNQARKTVRFVQTIPLTDYRDYAKIAAALRVRKYTLLSYPRLAALYDLARDVPPGAFVECGVYNGGSAGMIASADPSRDLWLFDSWQGLPEPGEIDVSATGYRREKGWDRGSEALVRELLVHKLGFRSDRLHLVRGWFEDTLAVTDTGPIALLHLDSDWYDSISLCLRAFHPRVVAGGAVIVDDYSFWKGARTAVDEFRERHNFRVLGEIEGGAAAYWRT